jgi:hypothetical protein
VSELGFPIFVRPNSVRVTAPCGKTGNFVIGFSQANNAEPYGQHVNYELSAAAKKVPQFTLRVADGAGNVNTQTSQMDNFITQKVNLIEPPLSRDSNRGLYLKFGRTWCPWAVWRVRSCCVRFAIDGPRRACRTAEPECLDTLRVADRPAAHAWSKLHKVNPNRRGERPRFIATLRIGHELRGSLLVTAEPAFGCRSFNRAPDFGHFAFATFLLASRALSRLTNRRAATFSLHTNIILGPCVCE